MPKKKIIKDLTFDHDNGHVALVGPSVGGAANLQNYALCLKSGEGFTDEIIEKATQVKVTLSIEEYLSRFFGLYWDDALVLATALGFTTEESEKEQFDYVEDYQKYIDERVGSIEVMKSMKDDKSVDALTKMNGETYLKFLQDQEVLEKVLANIEKANKPPKAKRKESGTKATSELDTQQIASVEKKVEPQGSVNTRKETMTNKEVKTVVADVEQELVAKSALESVQKALDDQKEELSKALELVKQFKQEKQDAITKARKEKLEAVVKNKEQAEVLFKAFNLVEADADFDAAVGVLGQIQKLAEKSDLFKSVGADGTTEVEVQKSAKDINEKLISRLEAKKTK